MSRRRSRASSAAAADVRRDPGRFVPDHQAQRQGHAGRGPPGTGPGRGRRRCPHGSGGQSEASMGAWLETSEQCRPGRHRSGRRPAPSLVISVADRLYLRGASGCHGGSRWPGPSSTGAPVSGRCGCWRGAGLGRWCAWPACWSAGGLLAIALFVAVAVLLVSDMARRRCLASCSRWAWLFLVAVVWISIRLLVAPAAIVVEELGALDGLRRSWQLTRTTGGGSSASSLVVSLLIGIIGQIVTDPGQPRFPGFSPGWSHPHGGARPGRDHRRRGRRGHCHRFGAWSGPWDSPSRPP